MDSTRPIRALTRGLDALTFVNACDGATVADVVGAVRLPRTTVYRLLETLRLAGYLHRDPTDERYRITPFVRGLGDRLDAALDLGPLGRARIAASADRLGHAISLATPSGATMRLHETGEREPLLASASGIAYLAACTSAWRDEAIAAARLAARRAQQPTPADAEIAERIATASARGHAALPAGASSAHATLAVALRPAPGREPIGALSLRFNSATLPASVEMPRFLAELQDCAAQIGGRFSKRPIDEAAVGAAGAGGPKE